ncbi:hypothetical protein NDU88_004336 [Pleurodeles waltl]|uniref:Uncharacterized protein n=1 Tax=Pleurodeles waltl TaxID=8319 RepID=A0AAV7UFV4_PLEWA|nr:hypothetical protein NDU88_004336 [Pleurodeles waltl]
MLKNWSRRRPKHTGSAGAPEELRERDLHRARTANEAVRPRSETAHRRARNKDASAGAPGREAHSGAGPRELTETDGQEEVRRAAAAGVVGCRHPPPRGGLRREQEIAGAAGPGPATRPPRVESRLEHERHPLPEHKGNAVVPANSQEKYPLQTWTTKEQGGRGAEAAQRNRPAAYADRCLDRIGGDPCATEPRIKTPPRTLRGGERTPTLGHASSRCWSNGPGTS